MSGKAVNVHGAGMSKIKTTFGMDVYVHNVAKCVMMSMTGGAIVRNANVVDVQEKRMFGRAVPASNAVKSGMKNTNGKGVFVLSVNKNEIRTIPGTGVSARSVDKSSQFRVRDTSGTDVSVIYVEC
jgi:hypothetical protein